MRFTKSESNIALHFFFNKGTIVIKFFYGEYNELT